MAALNAEQVLHLLMASNIEELDSGEETDIKEDLPFLSPSLTTKMNQIVPIKTVSFVTNILNNNNNSKLLYNYNNIIIIINKIIIIDEMEIEEPVSPLSCPDHSNEPCSSDEEG